MALRVARHVVHREDGVAGILREQPVFHHALGAAQAFFGGLEDQVERAVEFAVPGQVVRRRQQHGRVAIVAAGMHDAFVAAGVVQTRGFLDRQGVHVGAQPQALAAVAAAQLPDHASTAQTAFYFIAPLRQALRHQVAGAEFLEAQFGMAVDVPPDRDEFVGLGGQGLQDRMHVGVFLVGGGGSHGFATPPTRVAISRKRLVSARYIASAASAPIGSETRMFWNSSPPGPGGEVEALQQLALVDRGHGGQGRQLAALRIERGHQLDAALLGHGHLLLR
ncbi:hypothetical protein G6F57_017548 [Rhizopus arrhizus]|nr:hypothetical protein G6F57_017548 [Rhizopus arrhizus]